MDRRTWRFMIPIPGTRRTIWPGSRHVGELTARGDVLLTAWLRPMSGGELDDERARTLAATPPLQRTYADRKTLARQTGADPADVEVLRAYCKGFGIEVVESHWRSVVISGPIDRLIEAFGATVGIFADESGRRFRHRSQALHVPAHVAALVRGVFGLHQWPRSRKLGALQRHATPLRAADVASRYRFPDADGTGETIGVVQLRGVFNQSDFDRCMSAQGLAPAPPIVKRVDNAAVAHEIATTKDLEAALDVQLISSLAPGARIVVYEAPDDERGFLDAVRDALFDETYAPSVLSISYGYPEQLWTPAALDVLDELGTVAALAGVSVFCSSGDNGAELDREGKPHVLAPASGAFAIGCGATVIPSGGGDEQPWENTGGGFSAHVEIPAWQDAAKALSAQNGVPPGRGVPDVAAQEDPGYYVIMDGVELAMGGTSAVAPVYAALAARIDQRLGVAIGAFAPLLYARSGAGWNPRTGLGVPDGVAMEALLRGAP